MTLREMIRPQRFSLTTPFGHRVAYAYQPSASFVVLAGEGLPALGKRVKCEGFFVRRSLVKGDQRTRSCGGGEWE